MFLGLDQLTPLLEPEAHAWTWAVQKPPELWVRDGSDFDAAAFEQRVMVEPNGVQLSFEAVKSLAAAVGQIIWGELIAASSPANLPRRDDTGREVGRHASAGLAAIDSTFWLVGGPAATITRLAASFNDVDWLTPDDWIRADS